MTSTYPARLHAVFRIPLQVGSTNNCRLHEVRVFRLTRSSFRTEAKESSTGVSLCCTDVVILGCDIVNLLLAGSSHASQYISTKAMERVVPAQMRVRLYMTDTPYAYCYDGLVMYLNSITQIDVPTTMLDVIQYHVLPYMLTGRVTPTHSGESAVKTIVAQHSDDDEDDLYCYETYQDPEYPALSSSSSDSESDDEEVVYIDVSSNPGLTVLTNTRQISLDFQTCFASPPSLDSSAFHPSYVEQHEDIDLCAQRSKYACLDGEEDDLISICSISSWSS